MLHTQYVLVYKNTCILVINSTPLKMNPCSATDHTRSGENSCSTVRQWQSLSHPPG